MGRGETSRAIGCRRRPAPRRRVVEVADLACAIVDLIVGGADVRVVATPGGVRVTVADAAGHRHDLVERPDP